MTAAAFVITLLLWAPALAAEPNFPPLGGRVVDQANILSAETRAALTAKLKALEDKSGIQLVVATVSSLDGQEIEPYANQLFRTWKLGEAKKNNGVLFLVAPKEHRVRIEVGYGLEGTLTDATSKIIIANAVAPRFKAGDFNGGVERGVDDIITTLTADAADWQKRPAVREEDKSSLAALLPLLLFAAIFLLVFIHTVRSRGGIGPALLYMLLSGGNSRRGDFGGGGFLGGGGDSFSGGGGSSGGGGASGSW
ncbi:MAG TPA: TPM domain-containing protein [Roseiarcus sp.]|nr:TPM domain-containing protein [Roseiarcus sp.]